MKIILIAKITLFATFCAVFFSCDQYTEMGRNNNNDVAELTALAVISGPDITVYAKGQPFDPSGLVVEAAYSDDTIRNLESSEYTLSNIDTAIHGTKMITVSSGGLSAQFAIMVNNSTSVLQSITLTSPPSKTAYKWGENFNNSGLVLTGNYYDSETGVSSSKPESMYAVSGYDKTRRGTQTVTVTLNRMTKSFPVTLRIPADAGVSINAPHAGTHNAALDYQGVYVKGAAFTVPERLLVTVNCNGVKGALSADDDGVNTSDFSGYDMAAPGRQQLTLKLDDAVTTLDVFVADVEPEVYFDYGYMRQQSNIHGTVLNGGEYYTVSLGRAVVLAPVLYLIKDAQYSWQVTGGSYTSSGNGGVNSSTFSTFSIKPDAAGDYSVTVTVTGTAIHTGQALTKTAATTVRCVSAFPASPPAQTAGAFTSPLKNFAPGQFTRSGSGYGWSLGAAGGYMVWRLRQSNTNTYNVRIRGNPMPTWSEPGIVWVMADENQNGLPDDTWYELKGSDDSNPSYRDEITRCYAITYFNPQDAPVTNQYGQSISGIYWIDSKGRAGNIPGGWPADWGVTGSKVTFTGTLLRDTGRIATAEYNGLDSFDWGYVDAAVSTAYADRSPLFNINDAIQRDGSAANLPWIDFIKVQTAVFRYGGVFGEVSTEVRDADGLGSQTDFPDPS
jgi:hypothetical protein